MNFSTQIVLSELESFSVYLPASRDNCWDWSSPMPQTHIIRKVGEELWESSVKFWTSNQIWGSGTQWIRPDLSQYRLWKGSWMLESGWRSESLTISDFIICWAQDFPSQLHTYQKQLLSYKIWERGCTASVGNPPSTALKKTASVLNSQSQCTRPGFMRKAESVNK